MSKTEKLIKLKKAMMIIKVQQKMNSENQVFFNIKREIKSLIRKVQSGIENDKKGSILDAINKVYARVFTSPEGPEIQSNEMSSEEGNNEQ